MKGEYTGIEMENNRKNSHVSEKHAALTEIHNAIGTQRPIQAGQ
jgi:hypothetical protein